MRIEIAESKVEINKPPRPIRYQAKIRENVIWAVRMHFMSCCFVLAASNRDEILEDYFRGIYQCVRHYEADEEELRKAYEIFLELLDTPIDEWL